MLLVIVICLFIHLCRNLSLVSRVDLALFYCKQVLQVKAHKEFALVHRRSFSAVKTAVDIASSISQQKLSKSSSQLSQFYMLKFGRLSNTIHTQ